MRVFIGTIHFLLISFSLYAQIENRFLTFTSENSPLPSNKIYCLTVDNNNVKWIGTDKGLARFDGINWYVYDKSNGLLSDDITSIVIDKVNNIWIINSVLSVYDGFNWNHFTQDRYENASVNSKTLAIDSNNIKWMTTLIEKGATAVCSFNDSIFTIFDWGMTNVDLRSVWKIKSYNHEKWIADYRTLWKYDDHKLTKTQLGIIDDFDISMSGHIALSTHIDEGSSDEMYTYFYHYELIDSNTHKIKHLPSGYNFAVSYETDSIKWYGINYSLYRVTNTTIDSFRNGFDLSALGLIKIDQLGNKWPASQYDWYHSGVSVYNENGIILTSLNKKERMYHGFYLNQNYPNPFNPTTIITYHLNKKSYVRLSIYDISGRFIMALIDKSQIAGEHSVTFNAKDLSSGVYIYRLKTNFFEQSRKMVLIH